MAQDNPNDTVQVEEPPAAAEVPDDAASTEQSVEPSANARGAEPVNVDGTGNTDAPGMDDADDEMPDAESEESEDVGDAANPSEPASNTNDGAISQPPNALSAKSEEETDDRSEIEKQPYDFDHCTVQIAIQLLPDDGDVNGRMVVVGVRSHLDTPILRLVRLNELGALPPLITTILDELKAELPKREQAAREAFEKKKEERAKRKSVVTASRTSSRGKKTKAISAAPASNVTATDNRPRPEVNVPTNPQQQMGLF